MKPLPPGCTLRPLEPGDEQSLLAFFRSHTEETVYQRYGYHLAALSRQRVQALVGIDQRRHVGLGVFERGEGLPLLHAVGRYYTESAETAEMAVVVRETQRRRGLATHLLRALAAIAAPRGLTHFRAQVLCENLGMRRLLEHYRPRVHYVPDAGAVMFIVAVEEVLRARFSAGGEPPARASAEELPAPAFTSLSLHEHRPHPKSFRH